MKTMTRLTAFYRAFERFGKAMGNVISTIFLTVFYFTVFALFALPYRLKQIFSNKVKMSAYRTVNLQPTLEDFKHEF